MNGEQKDQRLMELYDRQARLTHEFETALGQLSAMAEDFSEGSQQRFMLLMREVNDLRDQLWSAQQEERKLLA